MIDLRATIRLQLHQGFTLDDAAAQVPYFARLGISHVYASPLLSARPGSLHGYDVIDPTRVNPELGGEPALQRLAAALHAQRMGLIVDIVSNHMAVGGDGNPWWLDVLEWGANSRYAQFFDIQWQSHDPLMVGQLLVPFLRSDYGEVLANGDISLHFDSHDGSLYARHYEHRLPLTPSSYGEVLRLSGDSALVDLAPSFDALQGEPNAWRQAPALRQELAYLARQQASAAALEKALRLYRPETEQGLLRLHNLLERQHYRVASWRTATDDINWRRFFDINELGGLRVERPEVFEATHGKIFELIEQGLIDGLRIDHIDGLANPRAYCRRLRRRVQSLTGKRPQALQQAHLPIFVEKILGAGERLPGDWKVDGTTGYEFMNQVSLLQHDPCGEQPLSALWHALSGRPADFLAEVREARQLLLATALAGDLEEVAQGLLQVARGDIATRDLTLGAIRRALLELISNFPVYRTYAGAAARSEQDRRCFQQALAGAHEHLGEADRPLLAHLDRWLGGQRLRDVPPGPARRLRQKVLTRFQQLTSPTAAKAVEDTACYRSGVLLSRYDVGFDPQHFSAPASAFHTACGERAARLPRNLLATATHDHKRGEDTRARLAVLSERAGWYAERVRHWLGLGTRLCRDLDGETAPSAADQALLFQALLGSWPLELSAEDNEGLGNYAERLAGWQEKALREAKLKSTWNTPNEAYESACRNYLDSLLRTERGHELRSSIAQAVAETAAAGALNSLVQCTLRLTTPGVPDLYQGTEFWDFSLVDPDNRRPVDYSARAEALGHLNEYAELIQRWRDGHLKQALIHALLSVRKAQPQLFSQGDYRPLSVEGVHADKVLAFSRSHADRHLLVVVPRLARDLLGDSPLPHIPAGRWGDTRVRLPQALDAGRLTSLCSERTFHGDQGSLSLAEVLVDFPVNVLCLKSSLQEHRP
ncbi:malto-oligosyltrehalose synthase [Pseudomonas sp. LRF_L74]|uniref:malto-oligosyltrehalose synthase n=1 Tax=Pseudomonas sp. LRF_L74 TaxID=3369422 RepID=UPI003F62C8C8